MSPQQVLIDPQHMAYPARLQRVFFPFGLPKAEIEHSLGVSAVRKDCSIRFS